MPKISSTMSLSFIADIVVAFALVSNLFLRSLDLANLTFVLYFLNSKRKEEMMASCTRTENTSLSFTHPSKG